MSKHFFLLVAFVTLVTAVLGRLDLQNKSPMCFLLIVSPFH